jgi:DNA-binding MarR family transcriptional regulator
MAQRAVAPAEEQHGLGHLLMKVARELRTLADRQLEPLGLTMQQAELLIATHRSRKTNSRPLAHLLLTDEAGISRLVDRLEQKDLLRRRPGRDRRSLSLELTPRGRALVTRLHRRRAMANERLHAALTDAEIETVRRALTRILENISSMPHVMR